MKRHVSALLAAPVLAGALIAATPAAAITESQKIINTGTATGDWAGWWVSIDDNTAVSGSILGGDTHGAFVFTRDPVTRLWSSGQALDPGEVIASASQYGASVSVSGDTAVVGSLRLNSSMGAAYVFTRGAGGVWALQQKLLASDGAAADQFGNSVAIDGDDIVVGALTEDSNNMTKQGAAYTFRRLGTTWTQQQKLLASDAASDDVFGRSVSIDGDTIAIGGDATQSSTSTKGGAWVFRRSANTWTEQQRLVPADAATGDHLGLDVRVSGDTVVVGAYRANAPAAESGAAYFFAWTGTTWAQAQKVVSPTPVAGAQFGARVDLKGDSAIIGSARGGVAHTYARLGGTWTLQQELTGSDAPASALFASGVAIDGTRALVGAAFADSTRGAVYAYELPDVLPPRITQPPDIVVYAPPGEKSARVPYPSPIATDGEDGPLPVTCTPPSGVPYPLGVTVVTCSATDAAGNRVSTSFTITVLDRPLATPTPVATSPVRTRLIPRLKAPKRVRAGRAFRYRIVIRNSGRHTAKNVTVTDILPRGLVLSGSNRRTRTRLSNRRFTTKGRRVTWRIPRLAPGASKVLTLRVRSSRSGFLALDRVTARASNARQVKTQRRTLIWDRRKPRLPAVTG